MERERVHLLPGLAPIAAAEERTRIGAEVDHAGLIGMAGLDVPEALDGLIGESGQVETLIGNLPALAAIGATMDVRPEPAVVDGGVNERGVARIADDVIDLVAGVMGAVDLPLLAVFAGRAEGALAGPDPESGLHAHAR
jgi:hypothetical protein